MTFDIEINSVFPPKRAIRRENQDQFIGREDSLKKALITLNSGSILAIIGERGIGKTSLAWQLMEVFSGNDELLRRNNISLPVTLSPQSCIWIECMSQIGNTEGLIIQLLSQKIQAETSTEISIPNLFREALQSAQVEQRLNEIIGSENLESFSAQVSTEGAGYDVTALEGILDKISDEKRRLYTLFKEVLETIKHINNGQEPIIFIDEIDMLPDKSGIGDLLKSTNSAQFVLVGVADNISEIVNDHPSTERKFINSTINLDRFRDKDIKTIFDQAEDKLSAYRMNFSEEFRNLVSDYSDGFPFMIQAFGMNALTTKVSESSINVNPSEEIIFTEDDFQRALEEVIRPDLDMAHRYKRLSTYVNNSGKESILFLLSENKGWVEENDLLQQTTKYRFQPNLKELTSPEKVESSELELEPILIRRNEKIRFFDPIMRAIVKVKQQKGEKLYTKKRA